MMMRSRSGLLNGLIVSFVTLLMAGIGLVVGVIYKPPWDIKSIPSAPGRLIDIVHVDFRSYYENPSGDILYVVSNEGVVYSTIVFQDEWLEVAPIPHWDDAHTGWIQCTAMPEDFGLMPKPQFNGVVVDSVGVILDRPLSLILRCYALLDDGRIQVAVYSDGFSSAMTRVIICVTIGAVVGIAFSGLMLRIRNQKAERKGQRT